MAQPKQSSSPHFAIAVASVVLICAAGGWLLYERYAPLVADGLGRFIDRQPTVLVADSSGAVDGPGGPDDVTAGTLAPAAESAATVSVPKSDDEIRTSTDGLPADPALAAAQIDVDTELRKARFAADADLIVSPPEQNALFYYARILSLDADHQLALAESGTLLARALLAVEAHLAVGEYNDAYQLSSGAASYLADHALVASMQDALDVYVADLVASARNHAENGNDSAAADILESLGQMPGLSAAYLAASRDSVAAAQTVRIASQQQLIEEQQLARKAAVDEWAASVRDAINSGQLISPSGNNARELLDAREAPAETRNQLARELFAALIIASEESLGNDNLVDVEAYLRVASELDSEIAWGAEDDGIDAADLSIDADNDGWGDDNDTLAAQRDSVEEKLIAAYGNKVVGLADFVRVKATPAQYPVSAGRRNITGWVEVRFTVTKSGITENIEVVQAEPADVFDDSAIEAVRSWTFEPREYRGQSINQRTVARLVFNLE